MLQVDLKLMSHLQSLSYVSIIFNVPRKDCQTKDHVYALKTLRKVSPTVSEEYSRH